MRVPLALQRGWSRPRGQSRPVYPQPLWLPGELDLQQMRATLSAVSVVIRYVKLTRSNVLFPIVIISSVKVVCRRWWTLRLRGRTLFALVTSQGTMTRMRMKTDANRMHILALVLERLRRLAWPRTRRGSTQVSLLSWDSWLRCRPKTLRPRVSCLPCWTKIKIRVLLVPTSRHPRC